MKALLSLSCGCILALNTLGLAQARASDHEPPGTEAALNPGTNGSAPSPSPANAAAPADPAKSAPADSAKGAPADSAKGVPAPASQNATINLINRLVQRGVLTKDDADELIKQAEADAVTARKQAEADAVTARDQAEADAAKTRELASAASRPQVDQPPTPDTALFGPVVAAPPADGSAPPTANNFPPEDSSEEIRVPYVPETVRNQIAEEVRDEVMQKAKDENWATPHALPDWILRLTPFADFRLRYEGIFFPSGNDNTGAFPNFNAINTGTPFNTAGTSFSPQLDADKDRERFRLRVRLGAQMDLQDGFTFGLRIATGETDSPTSANQTLGAANGAQGGDFSKYAIWLDRAFVRYEVGGQPNKDFVVNVGRTDNPFFAPTELVWFDDLGFDGISLSGRYQIHDNVTPFATIGAFPIFNTDLNFSSNRPAKSSSEDKYLLAAQGGTNLTLGHDLSTKIAAAFYDFENIQGRLSSPFVPLTTSDGGDTDDSRPSFAQKGNTYFPIRDILPTADNDFGTIDQFQYYGLAAPFREIDFAGTVDYARFDPFHISMYGEFVKNLAFDYNSINAVAINNLGPDRANGKPGSFAGGGTGWELGFKAGSPAFEKRWDWYAGVSYQYEQSDATVDGFNDPNFGLGGTNLKGYRLFGSVALSKHINFFLRFLSANQVSGPTFRNDTLQFDFNATF